MFMTRTRFSTYAWVVLAYNLAVILWGAFVRATGSGAGCGAHWPLCNGVVVPRQPQVETMIEFTHRLTSGLAFLLVLILLVWAIRTYPKGHIVRLGAVLSMFFIITEALVGAGLVLFGWVANDQSVARVISISVHLVNTFLLLGALTLTAWWASGGERIVLRGQGASVWLFVLGFLGVLVLGISGAITALGDTLFPAGSLREGIAQDFIPTAHFLVRLRIWHPLIALFTGLYLILLSGLIYLFRATPRVQRLSIALMAVFVAQLVAGMINLGLLAPVWMQLVHLLLADLVWIVLVLLAAANFGESELRQNLPVRSAAKSMKAA
jgi:heme A synthase